MSRLLQKRPESYAGYICVLLLTSSALSFGDAGGKILTALEDWLQSQTLTEVALDHSDYDVDLKKLTCAEPIIFSVPAMSTTIVRSECPGEWRRFIKIPPNILEPQREKSDSVEGLVASKDIGKGEQVFEKDLIPTDIGRGSARNYLSQLPREEKQFAQRNITKGSLILKTDISTPKKVYKAKTLLMPMNSIQTSSFETDLLTTDVPNDAVESISDLNHYSLSRKVSKGEVLRHRHLRKRKLISRGDIVNIEYASEFFSINTRVIALEDGYVGDTVRVRNEESGRRLTAKVLGPGRLAFEQ